MKTTADEAQAVLERNISDIWTVAEWADELGYSRAYFSRSIKSLTEHTASQLITEAKIKRLEELVLNKPEIKAIELAQEIGLTSIRSLYQYLKRHCNCSIREFKRQILE